MEPTIGDDVVQALLGPLLSTLRQAVGLEGTIGALRYTHALPAAPDVVVCIEVSGGVVGPLIWSFTPAVAKEVARRMLPPELLGELPYDAEPCLDAVAELANVITSSATGLLLEAGCPVDLTPPRVHIRAKSSPLELLVSRTLSATVDTAAGQMELLIGLRPGRADGAAARLG